MTNAPQLGMREISLCFEDIEYPYFLGAGVLQDLPTWLEGMHPDRLIVVTDQNVWSAHGGTLRSLISDVAPVTSLVMQPGEMAKNLLQLHEFSETALQAGASRRSIIITLGGGIPGNLGGFLAAVLFRGIPLVHVPTTFLGANDSVISLKQAVNSHGAKNTIGTFHPPSAVFADTRLLATLPNEHFKSGVCELIKNVLIIAPEKIPWLQRLLDDNDWKNPITLEELIFFGVECKQRVMRNDKRERGEALVLEYGHTIGHALEKAACLQPDCNAISHGEAVAIGMMGAAVLAERTGIARSTLSNQHRSLLQAAQVRTSIPNEVNVDEVLTCIRRDNKRGYLDLPPGKIAMILLEDLGCAAQTNGKPLVAISEREVATVVRELRS